MVQPWPSRVARSPRIRRAVVFLALGGVSAACSSLLGIHDVRPADDDTDAQALDGYVIPKGDGPSCAFDDDASRFDDNCTFAP